MILPFFLLLFFFFFFFFFLMIRRPPRSTLFPYTTLPDLVRLDEDRVHAEGLVQERSLALHPEGGLRVREPEEPARREKQVEVELLRERPVVLEARLEEGNRLGGLVVRAEHG